MITILTYPNEILRQKAEEVTQDEMRDGSILNLGIAMVEAMNMRMGIGLAAPQVGVSKRVIVVNVPSGFTGIMINPVIISTGIITSNSIEGCLSFPNTKVDVERSTEIQVSYLTAKGAPRMGTFRDLSARCILHEIDHLNGVLMIDHRGEG